MGWPFLKGGGRSLLLREWVVVVFISLRRCFPAGAAEELNVVRDALGDGAFVPVLVLVAAVLPCSRVKLQVVTPLRVTRRSGSFVRFPMRMTLFMLALLFRKLGEPGSYLL